MECLIQSRTDQVGHTCIKNGKFLPRSLFYIEDFGYQRTTLTYHSTSQLKMQCLIRTQFQLSGIGSKVILEIRDSLTVGVSVINTQTTTYVDMFYQDSSCFQFVLQLIDTIAEGYKITHIQNLRANVEVKTDKLYVFHLLCYVYHLVHVLHTDTEFVFCQTGSYIGMCMCADIGIDTESNISNLILSGSQFIDYFQFGDRLDIETEDAILQSEIDFPICFADSCENNFIGRESGTDSGTDFSAAHTIGSHSALTDNGKYFRVGIGFNSVMH